MSSMPSQSPAALTVLLVDDDEGVRSIIIRNLEMAGFLVLPAASGPEGLMLAQQFSAPIDLLMADLSMPEMDGREVARRLAAIHPETKVLYLSGYSEGMLPGETAPDKAAPFMKKPFKLHELLHSVYAALGPSG